MEIALYEPEIPPNTGNIGRLCYCTKSPLHIIGKPAFSLSHSAVRRAGLDYWNKLSLKRHSSWQDFRKFLEIPKNNSPTPRILLFSRFAKRMYAEHIFASSDVLVFGAETQGLPKNIIEETEKEKPLHILRIPVAKACRSLNLSNAVAVVLFEALRQQNFKGLQKSF